MTAEAIETGLGDYFYTAPAPTFKFSPDLIEDNFEDEDYVKLDKLLLQAAPEIDAATFHYVYGDQIREGDDTKTYYERLDIIGKFVRIEIPATVEDDEPIIWYGQVMALETEAMGTTDNDNPLGVQRFVALGLLHLLDKVVLDSSYVKVDGTTSLKIETGLPFNFDQGGQFPYVGNAATVTEDGETRTVFAKEQRSALKWSAADVVKYLLYRFAPKNNLAVDANPWAIDPDATIDDIAGWYEFSVPSELRTVKNVLDDVLSRHRGMSYFVKCEPPADTSQPNNIYLVPFSFAESNVTLPSGGTLSANANQRTINPEQSLDVIDAVVSDISTSRYHKVRVYGEYMTSTFTTSVYYPVNALEKDWSSAEETSFLNAASGAADYPADPLEQAYRNAVARTQETLRAVFCRYRISENWDGTSVPWHDDIANIYLVAPVIGDEDATIDPLYASPGNTDGMNLWYDGMTIERHLPFHDRYDYSGTHIDDGDFNSGFIEIQHPDFMPLLVYVQVSGADAIVRDSGGTLVADTPRFEHVEKLNHVSFDDENGRRWACHVNVRDTYPGIEVRAHPPQMLGSDEWGAGTPATTDESHDPSQMNGLRWQDIYATMTIRLQKRVQATRQILALSINEPVSTLAIYVPGARLDWVTPYTTVRLDDGVPIVTTTGGLLQDDRMRVADIARGAAEWYGDNRRTLSFSYKQVRNLFQLGWLITDIGPNYTENGINTPITSIAYIFGQGAPVTQLQTSFAALDYSR